MKKLLFLITLLFTVGCSNINKAQEKPVELKSEGVNYEQDGKTFQGYIVRDDAVQDKQLPGVLVIHPWAGIDDFTRAEADKYAQDGYVVFAMDMFGTDTKIEGNKDAARVSGSYRNNRKLMRHRIEKALEVLKSNKDVDPNNIGVVGYCFGGDAAIDFMLYKEAFKAGVSIHGFYKSSLNGNTLNGALEIHHGEADTLSTMEDFNAFKKLYPNTETYLYDGAGHAFTVDTSPNFSPEDSKVVVERTREFLKKNLK